MAENYCNYETLSEDEINQFFDELDLDKDGYVTFDEIEAKLEEVHQQLAPEPKQHHLHHPRWRASSSDRTPDPEKGISQNPEHDGLQAFLRSSMPGCGDRTNRQDFAQHVRNWQIPSPEQTSAEAVRLRETLYEQRLSWRRSLRAHWSVEGPQIVFMAFVIALQVAFGVWQGVKYIQYSAARHALGWGVIMAKFAAGALYPTLFFVFLSMSRWTSTYLRRFYHLSLAISRCTERLGLTVDWDHHQWFHILMSCEAYVFAVLHAVGHLTGTFLYGSRPAQADDLEVIFGWRPAPMSYVDFVKTVPGWSGITALGIFTIMFLTSMPMVRKWSFELFQYNHLLMFPFAGMLFAHGTAGILQAPALGYVLAFPVLLVILERLHRIVRGSIALPAKIEILDDDTVALACRVSKRWQPQAGQYVFLQVPSVSWVQWHPFTISKIQNGTIWLHIKTEKGGWTEKLRPLAGTGEVRVGLDGPFGAPAQRFYHYDRSIIVGSGIGVTPFSAILSDLAHTVTGRDPWRSGRQSRKSSIARSVRAMTPSRRRSRSRSRRGSPNDPISAAPSISPPESKLDVRQHAEDMAERLSNVTFDLPRSTSPDSDDATTTEKPKKKRRVDFIWSVRERNNLLWFSSLLNEVHDLAPDAKHELEINVRPYITAKRKGMAVHVFRRLLDLYRTKSSPVSALTGLKMESSFGRPDYEMLLGDFHRDLLAEGFTGKVGVFFCGNPMIGRVLSDASHALTARARQDGIDIRYDFMIEVFS